MRDYGWIVNNAAEEWQRDKAARLGAALAYYAAFSIGPLLLLVVSAAGMVFGEEAAQGRLIDQLGALMGPEGAAAVQAMLAGAKNTQTGTVATILGLVMLIVGAAGAFGAIQDALNTVWQVQPRADRGFWAIVHDRFLSFSMVLGSGFLLLVSLVISAALAAMSSLLCGFEQISLPANVLHAAASLTVITVLFAMIFKYLPDATVPWRDVWFGAIVTSILFAIGKFSIGWYLGHSSVASTFGAAGSLAVLMVWLYYSAQIFLFGAELTKAFSLRSGRHIVPVESAERVTGEDRAQQGLSAGAP